MPQPVPKHSEAAGSPVLPDSHTKQVIWPHRPPWSCKVCRQFIVFISHSFMVSSSPSYSSERYGYHPLELTSTCKDLAITREGEAVYGLLVVRQPCNEFVPLGGTVNQV
jgi:hypothetical protein